MTDADGSSLDGRPLLGSDAALPARLHRVGQRGPAGRARRGVRRGIARLVGVSSTRRGAAMSDDRPRGHPVRAARRRRRAVPRLPAPLRHRARQARHLPGPREPRRHALQPRLRPRLQRGRRPHREEAAVPLLPGHDRAVAGHAGLQLHLRPLPELADRARRRRPAACADLRTLPVDKLPVLAGNNDCAGVAWTYNEPTIWIEYVIDGAQVAHEHGLYTVMVTNGYITREALDAVAPHIDAYRVDVKGFDDELYTAPLPGARSRARAGRRRARPARARLSRRDRHQRHPHAQRRRGDAARHRRLDGRAPRPQDALARDALPPRARALAPAGDADPARSSAPSPSVTRRGSSSSTSATCRVTRARTPSARTATGSWCGAPATRDRGRRAAPRPLRMCGEDLNVRETVKLGPSS